MEKDIDNIINTMRALPTKYLHMIAYRLDHLILERDEGYRLYIQQQNNTDEKPKRPLLTVVRTEEN